MFKPNRLFLGTLVLCLIFSAFQLPKNQNGLAALLQHFQAYVDKAQLPGTVILVEKDGLLTKNIYGYQDIERKIRLTENSLFRLASMTKPLIAAATLQLVEQNRLQLEDQVEKYIPAVAKMSIFDGTATDKRPQKKMTIRHLLSHTSGITSGLDARAAGQAAQRQMAKHKVTNLPALVRAITDTQLAFEPGEGWAYGYSNDLLAYIIQQVTKQSIEEYLIENILGPLEMHQTRFQAQDKEKLTTVYATDPAGGLRAIETASTSKYTNGQNFGRGNGGLVGTAGDYLNFAKMLLQEGNFQGRQILSAHSVQLMLKNAVPDTYLPFKVANNVMLGQAYGLGLGLVGAQSKFGTPGDAYWPGALYTYFFISPEKNAIGIFMTQLYDPSKMDIIWEFHDLATQAIN